MKTSEILTRAKDLIAMPDHWVKGVMSGVFNGKQCYCSVGALTAVTVFLDEGYVEAVKLLSRSLDSNSSFDIVAYNDAPERKHEEILALFDKAIAIALAKDEE